MTRSRRSTLRSRGSRTCISRASTSSRELVHQGPKQRHRDHLRAAQLIFTSTFDGRSLEPYLEALRTRAEPDTWWRFCAGYPGSGDAAAFAGWVRAHQIDSSLFASAHPQARVPHVLESLELRERIIDFAIEAHGLDAAALQRALPRDVRLMPRNLPRRRWADADIDLADIQGDVLRGYTYPCAAYLLLRIDDVDRGARADAADAAAGAHRRAVEGRPAADRDARGLHVRGAGGARAAGGAARRRSRPSSARAWPRAPSGSATAGRARRPSGSRGSRDAHVLVTLYGDRRGAAARRAATRCAASARARVDARARAARRGPGGRARPLRLRRRDRPAGDPRQRRGAAAGRRPAGRARALARGRDGRVPARLRGRGRRAAGRAGRAVRPQRHVHGLPQARHGRGRASGASWPRRAIRAGRSCWPRRSSAAGPTARLWCARRTHRTRRSPPTRRGSTTSRTDDDADGLRCPIGSHIRRANPRDAEGFWSGRLTNRHRIIRRGRPYGPPLPPGELEDDGVERGLIFVCFNADIWRQFETIQALWIDDGDPFGLGPDKDFLVGEPHGTAGKMTIQGRPPFFLKPQPRFVTMRGGEYLYRPSIGGLRALMLAS